MFANGRKLEVGDRAKVWISIRVLEPGADERVLSEQAHVREGKHTREAVVVLYSDEVRSSESVTIRRLRAALRDAMGGHWALRDVHQDHDSVAWFFEQITERKVEWCDCLVEPGYARVNVRALDEVPPEPAVLDITGIARSINVTLADTVVLDPCRAHAHDTLVLEPVD